MQAVEVLRREGFIEGRWGGEGSADGAGIWVSHY